MNFKSASVLRLTRITEKIKEVNYRNVLLNSIKNTVLLLVLRDGKIKK